MQTEDMIDKVLFDGGSRAPSKAASAAKSTRSKGSRVTGASARYEPMGDLDGIADLPRK